jgi:hypothetical protein
MPKKEDRSDWVAVAPEFASATTPGAPKIKPTVTAFQFYQRDVTEEVKADVIAQNGGKFDVGTFSKAVRDHWNTADPDRRAHYESLARDDQARFAQESHAADIAAIERREKLQRERQTLLLDDEGGDRRSTRGRQKKKERKRERKEKKQQLRPKKKGFGEEDDEEDEDFREDGDESSDSYHEESDDDESDEDSDDDSADSGRPSKKKGSSKKPATPKRNRSQKQIEYAEKVKQEKKVKDNYIVERQEDLKKEKAGQAKRRLEFLLKQSNIFSHFGQVKQDRAKYGIKPAAIASDGTPASTLSRRDAVDKDDKLDQELNEADEHQATFLTSQPSTLAFGQMRQYQLEGLNWMIGLQENGVNGILADEVRYSLSILSMQFFRFDCADSHSLVRFLLLDGARKDASVDFHFALYAGISKLHRSTLNHRSKEYSQQLDERIVAMDSNIETRHISWRQGRTGRHGQQCLVAGSA